MREASGQPHLVHYVSILGGSQRIPVNCYQFGINQTRDVFSYQLFHPLFPCLIIVLPE